MRVEKCSRSKDIGKGTERVITHSSWKSCEKGLRRKEERQ
jgi:hypothetical protein